LHDLASLESRGVACVNIVTSHFAEAADAQCEALGFDPAIVYVPHPIQNRTTAELHRLADAYFEKIVSSMTVKD
jgi:hypothetical protein